MKFIYQCPVCRQKLEPVEKSFVCELKHSYDISREGYVNFLLANQKKTKEPGDSKAMAESRRAFLDGGFYDGLAEEIGRVLVEFVEDGGGGGRMNLLDVGCGVGFYSGRIGETLENNGLGGKVRFWGIDISKAAVQKAAKRYSGVQFTIGSSFHLPFLDESVEMILSVFAPFDAQEIFRVLKPGGVIVLVRPGPNHLKELAELIYGKFELQGNSVDLSESLEVSLTRKYQVGFGIDLKTNEDLMNLVNMTPYGWHLNEEKKALLAARQELKVTADFQIVLFEKNQTGRK